MGNNKLLLAFYGDDFTGSTDALEVISRAGMKAMLFIEPPGEEQLIAYPHLDAVGVAGATRSLSPKEMGEVLLPAFTQLKKIGARHVHYKVCSTFDSSPTVGSIGKAIDVASTVFQNKIIPLLVAAPALGRYCLFGNLFARMGTAGNGVIHRLDRHPSMSKHPVTPADESDIRLHLAKQTTKSVGLLDVLQLSKSNNALVDEIDRLKDDGAEVVLIDALYEEQLSVVGALIDQSVSEGKSQFSVGSSGVEMALSQHWQNEGKFQPRQTWPDLEIAGPTLVLSGSCSPVTKAQISWALQHGFVEIPLRSEKEAISCDVSSILTALQNGRSVIVHSGEIDANGLLSSQVLGDVLGSLGKQVCEQFPLQRIIVAGGDTSSYVARALGIKAVEMFAPLVAGAPLCTAFAPGSPVDGIQIALKGGQVGSENFFGLLKEGIGFSDL